MYNKRIICDIDDTICRTLDRNWENSEPIQEVIDKINYLYDLGWEIWLLTARGQLSCNGDWEKADKKYRTIIEKWLQAHGVKYHKLLFEKYLATYYVDDKNLTPKQFVDLQVVPLGGGWSGSMVELRDGKVYKQDRNAINTIKWYSKYAVDEKCPFKVPTIYSLIGETICMEFVRSQDLFPDDFCKKVIESLQFFRYRKDCYNIGFSSYIERIENHCQFNNKFHSIIPALCNIQGFMDLYSTECHGDFSIHNILGTENELYLIDPIFEENAYHSYLLDVAKFRYSLLREDKISLLNIFDEYLNFSCILPQKEIMNVLEISEAIRTYKYAPESEKTKVEEFINKGLSCLKK